MCNFRFKSLILNGYLTSLPWGIVNLGVKFFNVRSIIFRSVGIWPLSLNTFSNIRFSSYIPASCRVLVWGYICRECYMLKWCLCVLSFTAYFSFFFSFLSMWSVWWLLYINYSRIERKKERERTKNKIGFLSYVLIFWWSQMISVVCLYLTPI